jgi:elongation factor P--(R)-beta-lysine ligase
MSGKDGEDNEGREWWRPEAFARRRPALEMRGRVVAALRSFFAARGFVEVETPSLQPAPAPEPHIMPLATELSEPLGGGKRRLYLHASPEFAMKKLMVAGVPRLFQIARVWRDGERSPIHHPEFTLLEWYRAGEGYESLIEDCAGLLRAAAEAAGARSLAHGARRADPLAAPQRLTVAEAFQRFCDIDLLATAPDPRAPERDRLAAEARRIGLFVGTADSWEDIFHRIMLDRIEPHLGEGASTVLMDYPLSLAALARPSPRDPRLAERLELYACGLELANGFGELTDPAEQRRRFLADQALKQRLYGVRYPIDEELLAALEAGMPPSAGIALGVDRLVMLLAGAERIEEVLWAPVYGGE